MRYTSGNTSRTATVWSPGPLANSVWAIDDETGAPVVVKMLRGKVDAAQETREWSVEHGMLALEGVVDPAPVRRGDDRSWTRWTAQGRVPVDFRAHSARMHFREAPALSAKVWRAAVGSQCECEPLPGLDLDVVA